MDEFTRIPVEYWGEYAWELTFRALVRETIQPHENIDDVIAGGRLLGQHRANVLERPFDYANDVFFALAIPCYLWPFKPQLFEESRGYLLERRWQLFENASKDEKALFRLRRAIPNDVLRLELSQLLELLHNRPIWDILKL